MNDEPTNEPISDDDTRPATKGDVAAVAHDVDQLATATKNSFVALESKMATKQDLKTMKVDLENKMDSKLDSLETRIDGKLDTMKDEIMRGFNVVAENIHKDVAGANQDEISLIKDQHIPDHEDRIQDLEKHAKLLVGPRHAAP